ncbi:MAG: hypothetical protein HUJ69_08565 [Lachnospiraceae bacterium]|nr:hypothetical protein [Lachnospiraceae bacterium]
MNIKIDINAKTTPTDYSWQFGLGADHAAQFRRTDMVEQLRYACREIGFQRVRFHGIFDDDLASYTTLRTLSASPQGKCPVYEQNFRQVGVVLDNVLSCGAEPFIELSFMPQALASGKKQGLRYPNNITPPGDYHKWADYVTAFIRFLFDRYGQERVESWYFEVWNEPDLGIFFAGKQSDYFKLYEATARALKACSPRLRVGGPSTSACRWIPEFRTFCRQNNVPLDFLSTHHYPGDGFGNSVNAGNIVSIAKTALSAWKKGRPLEETLEKMFYDAERAAQVPKGTVTKLDDELLAQAGDMPTFLTEWNSMAIFAAPVHDEKYSAAFAFKTVLDLDGRLGGYMFWCLSDIFEEQVQLNRPFCGGFGLLTIDGIPKPNFWAFKLLSKLCPNRLETPFRANTPVEYAAFRDGNRVQVAVYAQDNDPRHDQAFAVDMELNGEAAFAEVEIIDSAHCNPKAVWQELGSPDYLHPDQVPQIKAQTCLRAEEIPLTAENGVTRLSCSLRTNDIHLYTFTLKE